MEDKRRGFFKKLRRKRNPLKKSRFRISTIIMTVFSLSSLYFLGLIIHWYFSGEETIDLLATLSEEEIVGVVINKGDKVEGEEKVRDYPFLEVDFKDLKARNNEVVAWLRVDAVDISMPIVQTSDNDYYLDHDIDKKKNNMGWVFADARSQLNSLTTNSVLYGHNVGNKQMFGSLKNIFNVDPERVDQLEIIQLTTPETQMVFEISSVYVTTFEDWKYVQHTFPDDESKRAFVDRMKAKNQMKIFARDNLSLHDTFLTFSTCYGPAGTPNRLVIHARMVAQQPNY